MKQILVPTDFSDTAQHAISFAIETSKIFPAKLTLIHSYEINPDLMTDYVGVNKEFYLRMLSDLEKKLDAVRDDIHTKESVEADTFISTYPLNQAIKKATKEQKTDLIVMGTLGASGIKEKLWGSHTSSLIGKTKVPVIVIPHSYTWRKPEKILLVTNKFQKDSKILNYIFELAGLYMANIQVGVFTDTDDEKTEQYLENEKEIKEYEAFLKENYNESTLISIHLTGEKFEETLQDYIQENEIDMLVMVTYQGGFWDRLFNPSKTKRMSYHTQIPLLVIPA